MNFKEEHSNIILLTIYKGKYWYINLKEPRLFTDKDSEIESEEDLKEYIDVLIYVINNEELNIKHKDKLFEIIYKYIKLEVCFNKDKNSRLLNTIKMSEYNDIFENMIETNTKEILESTFVNKEMLEFFKRKLSIQYDLLNSDIIRSIVMCENYNLIRKGNASILSPLLSKINVREYYYQQAKLNDSIKKIKSNTKYKQKASLKASLMASLLTLTIGTGIVSCNFFSKPIKSGLSYTTYKTTTETFSSLGTHTEEVKYEKENNMLNSSYVNIYNIPFEQEGELYRIIDTYKIKDFDTSELESYLSYDYAEAPFLPLYSKSVKVSENDTLEEYIIVEKYTQDLNDKEENFYKNQYIFLMFLIVLATVLVLCLPGVPITIELIAKIEDFISDRSRCIYLKKELYEIIYNSYNLITENGYTLDDAIKLVDEIIGTEGYDNLSDNYKQIIEKYKQIKSEHDDFNNIINEQNIKKALKMHKEK